MNLEEMQGEQSSVAVGIIGNFERQTMAMVMNI